jgi:K+ transporter
MVGPSVPLKSVLGARLGHNVTSTLLVSYILLSTLLSGTLSLFYSKSKPLIMFHTETKRHENFQLNISICMLISTCLVSRWEDKNSQLNWCKHSPFREHSFCLSALFSISELLKILSGIICCHYVVSLSWILATIHNILGSVYRCVRGSHDRTQNVTSDFDSRTVMPTVQKRALHVDECEETIADCNDTFIVIRTIHCQGTFLWTAGMSRIWYEWRLQNCL